MELLKLLSASEIIAQVIGFLILLVLLRVFAWKKILGLLDKRRERIAQEFNNIEKSKADLEVLKAEYAAKISHIEEEAHKRIESALVESKLISDETRKKAHLEAQVIIDNAKASIKYEIGKAKDELRNEIVDLTIKATENLIREKITEVEDKKLVKDFLDQVDKL